MKLSTLNRRFNSADFLAASSTCINATSGVTVPAGGSCTVDVQYKPTATAIAGTAYPASIAFNLNTAVKPTVNLSGTPRAAVKVYYLHTDHLDTPRSITNTAGQEVWRWDNTDPFGNNLANENPSALGTFTFNLRFPGQYFDKETGLHYNVNRDYNPAVGRYIQSDPIGLRGGINTYGYVGGNPLRFVDPKGKNAASGALAGAEAGAFVCGPLCALAGGVVGAIGGYLIADQLGNLILSKEKPSFSPPPGYWPGDKGAKEWGRRDGCGAAEGKRRFHRGVKQGDNMSGAADDFYVNPETGDVLDPEGESIGNLNDE